MLNVKTLQFVAYNWKLLLYVFTNPKASIQCHNPFNATLITISNISFAHTECLSQMILISKSLYVAWCERISRVCWSFFRSEHDSADINTHKHDIYSASSCNFGPLLWNSCYICCKFMKDPLYVHETWNYLPNIVISIFRMTVSQLNTTCHNLYIQEKT